MRRTLQAVIIDYHGKQNVSRKKSPVEIATPNSYADIARDRNMTSAIHAATAGAAEERQIQG
jgi:hypothetical protein